VSVLSQILEILLLLKKPLAWQKWRFCHLHKCIAIEGN
jgi:hypothetical protein